MHSLMSSSSLSIPLFLLFLIIQTSPPVAAQTDDTLLYNICDPGANYKANSTYEANLGLLLRSLSAAGDLSGFSNNTVGAAPDSVFGMVLCRGDIVNKSCGDCLRTAAQNITQLCPFSKAAIIWFDFCFLRYSDQNFFSPSSKALMLTGAFIMYNVNNVSMEEQSYINQSDLIAPLVKAAPTTRLLYAVGDAIIGNSSRRYAYMQCTRDLNSTTCAQCLKFLDDYSHSCCEVNIGWRILTSNCFMRYEAYPFLNLATSPPPSPPPPSLPPPSPQPPSLPLPPPSTGNKGDSTKIIIIIVSAVVPVVLGFCLYYYCARKRLKSGGNTGALVRDYLGAIVSKDVLYEQLDSENTQELPLIDLETILAATENFSISYKLGEGGFGPVYKGTIGGKEVAIKRLSVRSSQGQKEFLNEVLLIAKLQHKNLVRLLFCCMEEEERLLVYEYMPNKSLDAFIFDPVRRAELDWETRLSIIGGVARGLMYLHEDSRLSIIHRDLKPSNILLDGMMNPKISDFGMARIFGGSHFEGNTARIVGTYGYMSPEYAMEGLFSVKSDVFSFGVMLLEILSGRKNNGFCLSGNPRSLIQYGWLLLSSERELELLDTMPTQPLEVSKLRRCIHIGLLCVQEDPADRPTISEVVVMLASKSVALSSPAEPPFSVGRSGVELAVDSINLYCSTSLSISGSFSISGSGSR